jgi:hypothetical protein
MNTMPAPFISRMMPAMLLVLMMPLMVQALMPADTVQVPDSYISVEPGRFDSGSAHSDVGSEPHEHGRTKPSDSHFSGFPPVVNGIMERVWQGTLSREEGLLHVLTYAYGTREELDHLAERFPAMDHNAADFSEESAMPSAVGDGSVEGLREHPPLKCLTSVILAFRDAFGDGFRTAADSATSGNANAQSGWHQAAQNLTNEHTSGNDTSGNANTQSGWHQAAQNLTNEHTSGNADAQSDWHQDLLNSFQANQTASDTIPVFEYLSKSGKFRLEYTLEGTHAVPSDDKTESGVPDYVEMAAVYADSSWNYLVGTLGFPDPVLSSAPYLIRFRKANYYGRNIALGNTTLIEVHSNFNGFPQNLDPDGHQLGALKATVAHELKHAIQYVTNRWRGDAGSSKWVELDATMTEDVVYPTVKDYLNYLRPNSSRYNTSVFRGAHNGIPHAFDHATYEQATFGLYYHQRFGPEFWVRAWDEIKRDNHLPMFSAMRIALNHYEADFDEEFFMNMAWHMAAGSRSRADFGFGSRELYPEVSLSSGSGPLPTLGSTSIFRRYSARFYEITPQPGLMGNPVAGLLRGYSNQSIGTVAFMHDGTVQTEFAGHSSSSLDFIGFAQNIDWSDVDRLGLVVINTGDLSTAAQFIAGTDTPAGLFLYGDVNLDRSLNSADAENLLMSVVGSPGPRATATSLLHRALSDVSDDGSLSVFDAALIYQKAADPLMTDAFPADPDGSGRFPAASRVFRADNTDPPLASVAAKTSSGTTETGGSAFEMRFEQSTQPDDDTLRVYVQTLMDGLWSSVFAEILYDSSLVALQRVYLPGVDHRRYIERFQLSNTGARIGAIARHGDVTGDVLALYFVPLQDTTVSINLPYIELDESDGSTGTGAITAKVRPADGVGIERPVELPATVQLLPNYPNPFNPSTTIAFETGSLYRVQLDVYDATGRHVAALLDETVEAGRHQKRFHATGLATGLYIVRLTALDPGSGARSYTQTQKILYIR